MTSFGRFSTYQSARWISQINGMDLYFGLAATDPFIGDPLAAEITGGSYGRQIASFELVSTTAMEQTQPVAFSGLAPGTVIAAVMCFDAPTNGNMISAYLLDSPITLTPGGTYSFAAGQYVHGIDVATI